MTTSLERGCDCLGEITYLDAVVHDSAGEPQPIPPRHLHPRRGQRGAVEARGPRVRRRGPPGPAARGVVPRHRGELRVPGLLALLPGRQHRVRGPGDRDHGHLQLPAGPAAAVRHAGGRADLRAVPPALHRGPARPRRGRAGPTRCTRSSRRPSPRDRTTRTGSACVLRQTPLRTEAEGQQDYDWATQRGWKVVNTDSLATGSAPRPGTSWCPAGAFPAMLDPARRCCSGPG